MKTRKNLYLLIAICVTCSAVVMLLLLLGFFAGNDNGWSGLLGVMPYIIIVGGVAWLGWSLNKLKRAITSAAMALRSENTEQFRDKPEQLPGHLVDILQSRVDSYSEKIEQLQQRISDLRIQSQLLQKQKRNTEAIIYSLRDAVIVVDEQGRVLLANEIAGRLFSFDFKKAQYRMLSDLINEDNKRFVGFLDKVRASKTNASRCEFDMDCKDGVVRSFNCTASCVYDDKGQICGIAAILRDVTREKEIANMKNDFVSHVSHELKTPLASIIAYSEMLVDGEADDEQTRQQFYSVIQNQAKRLHRMIEDILNISRIESGLIKLNKENVSLAIVIEEQLDMIRGFAEEKDIRIESQKPIVYDQVYADKDMISQVIVNLLSNAVKYTHAGGTVTVRTEVDDVAQVARVTVTDTGVGIAEDDMEHIFDKFYRTLNGQKKAKGTGLGLNLVKQIIEKTHSGRVFVSSKLGQGSTFGFELPLTVSQKVNV